MTTPKRPVSYASALADAHDAVNALGGAATTPAEKDYSRGLDEVLWSIEGLQAEQATKELETRLEGLLALIRRPYNGFSSPEEAAQPISEPLKTWYVSLGDELLGVYIRFRAVSELAVREYLERRYLTAGGVWKLPWCSVYGHRPQPRPGSSLRYTFIDSQCGELWEDSAGASLYHCDGCGRPESECSADPCPAVIADRGEDSPDA